MNSPRPVSFVCAVTVFLALLFATADAIPIRPAGDLSVRQDTSGAPHDSLARDLAPRRYTPGADSVKATPSGLVWYICPFYTAETGFAIGAAIIRYTKLSRLLLWGSYSTGQTYYLALSLDAYFRENVWLVGGDVEYGRGGRQVLGRRQRHRRCRQCGLHPELSRNQS